MRVHRTPQHPQSSFPFTLRDASSLALVSKLHEILRRAHRPRASRLNSQSASRTNYERLLGIPRRCLARELDYRIEIARCKLHRSVYERKFMKYIYKM